MYDLVPRHTPSSTVELVALDLTLIVVQEDEIRPNLIHPTNRTRMVWVMKETR